MTQFNKSYKEYYQIMEDARKLCRSKKDDYFENHHIIPKSMGGSNSPLNMVLLTPEEHYICHSLLPDFCEGRSYYKAVKGWNALNNMSKVKNDIEIIGPEKYGKFKRDYAISISGINSSFARGIYQVNKDTGEIIKEWGCISDAARFLLVDSSRISHSARGENRTCCDFVWVFPEDYNKERKQEIINNPYDMTGSSSTSSKPVFQIDNKTGEVIKNWACITAAEKILNIHNISLAANGLLKLSGGYVWVFPEDYTEKRKQEIINQDYSRVGSNNPSASSVCQLDKDTNQIIKIWGCITEASNQLQIGPSCISACCRGKQKTAGGFKWKYK